MTGLQGQRVLDSPDNQPLAGCRWGYLLSNTKGHREPQRLAPSWWSPGCIVEAARAAALEIAMIEITNRSHTFTTAIFEFQRTPS